MIIEKIRLKNFRCYGSSWTEVNFQSEVTALVGANGSGKTALFLAISRLFGTSRNDRSVTKADFHVSPTDGELVSETALEIECLLGFPELDRDTGAAEPSSAVPEFFSHMAASGPNEPLKARIRLVANWVDDGTLDGLIEEDLRWITSLGDDFDWEACPRVSAVDRASIQLVYVPALRNASDRVGHLLKGRLWRAAKWSEMLRDQVSSGSTLIQRQFDQEAPSNFIIEKLRHRWQQVYEGGTDAVPSLRLVEGKIDELVRKAEFAFYPDEAGHERSLSDLSDGQRSLFHIALTAATLETEASALAASPTDSPFDQDKLKHTHLTILAIEEPENSLAPFYLSRIIEQVREIGAMNGAQVLISSHSASVMNRIEVEEVRYFRVNPSTRATSIKEISLPNDDLEAQNFIRLAVQSYPELYFAKFVILAEGDSEKIVIPRIAQAKSIALDPSFVPVVPLGGRYVSHFWTLLNDLEIPFVTLLDLDVGRRHGGANMIRTTYSALEELGKTFDENPYFRDGSVCLDKLESLTHEDIFVDWQENYWLQAFAYEGIFFSNPLDLDFAMLRAFPKAYQHKNPGGRGPRNTTADILGKKNAVLKKGNNIAIYEDDLWDECFTWYPYLFLSRSKPATHLAALSRIADDSLEAKAPPELRELIEYVSKALFRANI